MTEQGSSLPTDSPDGPVDDVSETDLAPFGDPSLELFGLGWSPTRETATNDAAPDTGRHRAPDAEA